MRRDILEAIILGTLLIVAIIIVSVCFGKKAEAPETTVTAVELVTELDEETVAPAKKAPEKETATRAATEVQTEAESVIETWAVVDTAPAETVYLNIEAGGGYLDVPFSREEQDIVRAVSEEYGIPFALTMAIIYTESGFDRYAYSSHGDCGLMQIAPVNHGWLADMGIVDLWDVEQNVRAGLTILSEKLASSDGDFTTALMRYNRGDGVAEAQMRDGIYSTDYTNRVLTKYYEYLNYGG